MKLAVLGHLGCVGSAVKSGLERVGHKVIGHDTRAGTKIEDVLDTKVAFICVPTPSNQDGSCNTDIVESVVKSLNDLNYSGIIAIKSTVQPGTCLNLQNKYPNQYICFVPEFLRERSAFSDFVENHNVCVIGTNNDYVYQQVVLAHGKLPKKFVQLTPTEAELVKYYHNVFNALRVVWANNFYDICQKLKADYTKVKDAALAQGAFLDLYMDCNENFRGYCGVCLPKDSKALSSLAHQLGVPGKLFDVIVEDNKLWRADIIGDMRRE